VVNFGQNPYLDQDFTSDVNLLQRVRCIKFPRKEARAVRRDFGVGGFIWRTTRTEQEKFLLVITDGQDNMSQETLQELRGSCQQANGPQLYAIGLFRSGLRGEGARRCSTCLKQAGVAYFPDSLDQVDNITRTVAHDIRSQYILAYKPRNQNVKPQYQSLRVEVTRPGV